MALQFMIGIPWLATFLGGILASITGFFLEFFTRRLAVLSAVLLAIAALTSALYVALDQSVIALGRSAPPEFGLASSLFLPDNVVECMTVYLAAQILRWAYDWNVKVFQFKLF